MNTQIEKYVFEVSKKKTVETNFRSIHIEIGGSDWLSFFSFMFTIEFESLFVNQSIRYSLIVIRDEVDSWLELVFSFK